jgi:hypothetical protein
MSVAPRNNCCRKVTLWWGGRIFLARRAAGGPVTVELWLMGRPDSVPCDVADEASFVRRRGA